MIEKMINLAIVQSVDMAVRTHQEDGGMTIAITSNPTYGGPYGFIRLFGML